jgi:rhodanese-related sulfurtransferase
LSSLLLVLLPVFAGIQGAEQLFTVASLVVLLSVVLHGGGIAYFLRRAERMANAATARPEAPVHQPLPILTESVERADVSETIEVPELRALLASGQPVVIVDVRRDRNLRAEPEQAARAVRLDLDDPVRSALREAVPKDVPLIVYCACPAEETSSRVVTELRHAGWTKARALVGGWSAWKSAGLPIESSVDAIGR